MKKNEEGNLRSFSQRFIAFRCFMENKSRAVMDSDLFTGVIMYCILIGKWIYRNHRKNLPPEGGRSMR